MMPALAITYREYAKNMKKVRLIEITAQTYYDKGYQNVQSRAPKIDLTCSDLEWKPRFIMRKVLKLIFDAYRCHTAEARQLMD